MWVTSVNPDPFQDKRTALAVPQLEILRIVTYLSKPNTTVHIFPSIYQLLNRYLEEMPDSSYRRAKLFSLRNVLRFTRCQSPNRNVFVVVKTLGHSILGSVTTNSENKTQKVDGTGTISKASAKGTTARLVTCPCHVYLLYPPELFRFIEIMIIVNTVAWRRRTAFHACRYSKRQVRVDGVRNSLDWQWNWSQKCDPF